MDDLAAFLAARLDEDETIARAAGSCDWYDDIDDSVPLADERNHAWRFAPARVLREVAAKRAILAAHRAHRYEGPYPSTPTCTVCITERKGYQEEWDDDEWPCATLRHLAAVYSDHPGYRQEWRP